MEREYRPLATAWSMNCTPQRTNGFALVRSYILSCMRTSRHRLAVGALRRGLPVSARTSLSIGS